MLTWTSPAIVLAVRPYGDADAVAEVLSADHGRYLGMVKGGGSRRMAATLQPGNKVQAHWSARLADQLGQMQVELDRSLSAPLLGDGLALRTLSYALALMQMLPERDAQPTVYDALCVLLPTLTDRALWPAVLVRFELGVLAAMGCGLDLSRCAGGGDDDLAYVSPRTGRAVSREVGGPYGDKLLPLPPFLLANQAAVLDQDVADGLRLTGYFVEKHLSALTNRDIVALRTDVTHALAPAGR